MEIVLRGVLCKVFVIVRKHFVIYRQRGSAIFGDNKIMVQMPFCTHMYPVPFIHAHHARFYGNGKHILTDRDKCLKENRN